MYTYRMGKNHKNKVVYHYIEENTEISTDNIYVVL